MQTFSFSLRLQIATYWNRGPLKIVYTKFLFITSQNLVASSLASSMCMRCRSSASVSALATIGRTAKQPAFNALSHSLTKFELDGSPLRSLLGTLILMGVNSILRRVTCCEESRQPYSVAWSASTVTLLPATPRGYDDDSPELLRGRQN